METQFDRCIVRRNRPTKRRESASAPIDGKSGDIVGLLVYCIKNISRWPNDNGAGAIASRNGRTHHGQAARIRINGEYGDVIGNDVSDVSEAPGGLHSDDTRI